MKISYADMFHWMDKHLISVAKLDNGHTTIIYQINRHVMHWTGLTLHDAVQSVMESLND